MTAPNFIELTVTGTAYGGKGIARQSGKVFFVEGAVEGDVVLAEITSNSERFSNAATVKYISKSPFRGLSNCPYSSECGGCQWQDISYDKQLEWKREFLSSSLRRIGKMSHPEINFIPSPKINSYRNRVMLKGRISTTGTVTLGDFKNSSRDFIKISRCEIAGDAINGVIEKISSLVLPTAPEEIPFKLELQEIPVAENLQSRVLATLHESKTSQKMLNRLEEMIRAIPEISWTGSRSSLKNDHFSPFDAQFNMVFHTAPTLFQQVNIELNHKLRSLVKSKVALLEPRNVLDLYCGSGNLSLALASSSCHVTGVEFSKMAIDCAKFNVSFNTLKNIEYFAEDTEKFLKKSVKGSVRYDLLIADPPREGMLNALALILKLRPRHIIYVSCDPTTLARDLERLCADVYELEELTAFDFFPNTYHFESMALLTRKKDVDL